MRKINWKRALEPHLWASISVIGAFVYQLSMLSEHASAESIYPTSFMIPSLIALGAIKVSFLSNTKYKANNNPLPSSPLIINSPAENNQLSNEIQHYQLLIEREIWKYENIKGWVSYELHEDICQTLIAARNHLYSHLPQQLIPSTQIEQARVILEEAIHKLKKLYEKLEVPPLQIMGLIPCIQQKIDEENKKGFTKIIFKKIPPPLEEIEESTKLMIYRIVAEKLNNINNHSKAKNAWVLLEVAAHHIIIKIEDNGIGFYNAERHWGNGFNVIKAMISAMGGCFEIKTAPGRGCKFFAQIPTKRVAYKIIEASDLNHSFSAGSHSMLA